MTSDQERVIQFWKQSAKRDIKTARDLVKMKHNDWALFIYHLAIEKLLKALVVKSGITPPYTHDLQRLAVIAKLPLSDDYRLWLKEITKFNVSARYGDDKFELYKKTTPTFTKTWSIHCEEIFSWLEHQIV